jgi:hypothetical protein
MPVPVRKMVAVWGSSVVAGVAAYFVSDSIFMAGSSLGMARARGRIEALATQPLGRPGNPCPEQLQSVIAGTRATALCTSERPNLSSHQGPISEPQAAETA